MTTPGRTAAMGTDQPGTDEFEQEPFAHALLAIAEGRPEILGMSADLARYTDMLPFAKRYPERFINVGMAEQNLLAVAAGLARTGYTPVAATYGVFATRRALDFLIIQAALGDADVKIVGGLPGLTTGYGATHQAIDDLAHVRVVPNLVVIDPADAVETRQATTAMLDHHGPVYMRLLRGRVPVVLDEQHLPTFEIGRARLVRDGSDAAIIACGTMVAPALDASSTLAEHHVDVAVLSSPCLKPFDTEAVISLAHRTGAVVTAENHSVIGGLFSAVTETLATVSLSVPIVPVGLRDEFAGSGSLPYLSHRHGLTADQIAVAVTAAITRQQDNR